MYPVTDKKAAIREIQKYLLEISAIQPELPHLVIDGVYGDLTRQTVIKFQELNGLDPTGKVNYETFTLMYAQYTTAKKSRTEETELIDRDSFPFQSGDSGDDVAIINSILTSLRNYYPDIGRVTSGNYYSRRSAYAVAYMQKIFGYPQTGITDIKTYNSLFRELNSRNTIKNSTYL